MDSLRFILLCLAGWINRQQQDAIAYLQEEVTALREQLGPKRPRFTDAQRRRLAARARKLLWSSGRSSGGASQYRSLLELALETKTSQG